MSSAPKTDAPGPRDLLDLIGGEPLSAFFNRLGDAPDRLAEAIHMGELYQTLLDPPSADRCVAHCAIGRPTANTGGDA